MIGSFELQVSLAAAMYEKGMLMTEQPLEPLSEGSSEEDEWIFELEKNNM